LLQIIEKGIKQSRLVHGVNNIHLMMIKQMFGNDGIIALSGMPEESVTESLL
jgi:hypothetical protein